MLGSTLKKIEDCLAEVASSVQNKSTQLLITKMKTFPIVSIDTQEVAQREAINYTIDELIRCQKALNSARRHLTNLGIEVEENSQTEKQVVRLQTGGGLPQVVGKPIAIPNRPSPQSNPHT